MKVMLCANLSKEKSRSTVTSACAILKSIGYKPCLLENFRNELKIADVIFANEKELLEECDLIITVGGDGTILKWGRKAALSGKPLLGINTGRLGFMATLECDELTKLTRLKSGEYTTSRRMLLDIDLNEREHYLAMNDVVFSKTRYAKLPEFTVCKGEFEVTRIRADGIIFSTPTGSTAYSLSAGGPIISPDAECIEFTPLCAHSLFGRPMIFSAQSDLSVRFCGYESSEVILSVDGDDDIDFHEGETVTIRKSDLSLDLIDINGGSFYSAVHNKLMKPLK